MDVCKWCGRGEPDTTFENAHLCGDCNKKAVWALENPRPCDTCESIFTNKKSLNELVSEDGFMHLNIDGLRTTAEKGCPLCRIFLLQDPNPDWARLQTSITLFAETKDSVDGFCKDITSLYFWSEADQFKLTVSVSADLDDAAATCISQRPIETNLANENTFKKARTWLGDCLATHTESRNPATKPRLPTRVISVGNIGDSEVRLYEPGTPTYEQYITLSYCWGKPPFLVTLKSNIDDHKSSMPVSALPKTIQDAIAATRGLGFRYIWIDALCIIQDSEEDKVKEIGGMCDIYHNSTLTIAAVSASAVSEGFLCPKARPKVTLPYRCGDGKMGQVLISTQKMVDLWQETMYTRAWCLQEYLLSSRLLLFTDTEVLWSCQQEPFRHSDSTHVTYDAEIPTHARSPFRRLPGDIFIGGYLAPDANVAPFDLVKFKEWTSICSNYSRRELTVLSDRLPALAGVAQKFQEAWGGEYYAGLWPHHFIELLSWRRSQRLPTGFVSRPEAYRAPSWSWASIEGTIEFHFQNGHATKTKVPGAKLISCTVEPAIQEFPLLEVKGGQAIVEGQMILLSASPIAAKSKPDRGDVYWDDHPLDSQLDEETSKNCWCVLLGEAWAGHKSSEAISLILLPIPGQQDTFKRIGLHRYLSKASSKAWAGPTKRRMIKVV
ncbi:heterokaryon incompatibility protein-domain-containing protein [Amylocarpus encephaloides]|uniref:Heterokaryon incompatibility protein-domain-containing protein n=1 Tax=Amylocarpus encephaloides TaxID=45428 RepID=A0A9P8C2N6_9HELO|nr:heterokaryon incompatibility protein-domain-containing protein [Amylocarpus encephaloides]